jgi:hypothetical protein
MDLPAETRCLPDALHVTRSSTAKRVHKAKAIHKGANKLKLVVRSTNLTATPGDSR